MRETTAFDKPLAVDFRTASKMLPGISVCTLRAYCRTGKLKSVLVSPRCRMILVSSIYDKVKKRKKIPLLATFSLFPENGLHTPKDVHTFTYVHPHTGQVSNSKEQL